MSDTSAGAIELAWSATEADHLVVQRRALRRSVWTMVLLVVLSVALLGLAVGWQVGPLLSVPFVGVMVLVSPAVLMMRMWRLPARQVARLKRAGMLALGPHRLGLDARGIHWRSDASESRLGWPVVTGIERDRGGLWITLATGMLLRVPERALGDLDLDRVRAWRAAPAEPVDLPYAGTPVWDLSGELTVDDWRAALRVGTRALQRSALRRFVMLLAAFGLLLGVLVALLDVVSGAQGGGGIVAFGILTLAALRLGVVPALQTLQLRRSLRTPGRVPTGPFHARLDPDGVWIRTTSGTTRFAWSWIGEVVRDDRVIVILVGLGSVVALPVMSVPDADRLVADCKTWIAAAPRLRGGVPSPGLGKADASSPFAPPER